MKVKPLRSSKTYRVCDRFRFMGRLRLALIISFLSITIAEYSTGSTPLTNIITDPASFFFFSLPALLGLYGCGVILIREAAIIWKRGLPTILALGLAYGIMEEGVSVHTFFAPVNATVGVFGQYGRVLGLDLTWAIIISIFHSLYSIALPILIAGSLWPETKDKRLLTKRTLVLVFIAYAVTVMVLDFVAPYRPPLFYTIFLVGASAALVYSGSKLPARIFTKRDGQKSRGAFFYLVLGNLIFPFLIFASRLQTFLPYVILDAEIIIAAVLIYRWLETNALENSRTKLSALIIGLIIPLLFFGSVINARNNPLGFIAIFALFYIIYKISKIRDSPIPPITENSYDQ